MCEKDQLQTNHVRDHSNEDGDELELFEEAERKEMLSFSRKSHIHTVEVEIKKAKYKIDLIKIKVISRILSGPSSKIDHLSSDLSLLLDGWLSSLSTSFLPSQPAHLCMKASLEAHKLMHLGQR